MANSRPATPMAVTNNTFHGSDDAMAPIAPLQTSDPSVRLMGLKVHYTFDKDAQINCLARLPHTLKVRTVAVDGTNLIGVVDLRSCLYAIMECSPELAQGFDYTVYALDYSEPDTPLVGQGMLSRALESMREPDFGASQQLPKLVTGRVTMNVMSVFSGGMETLEVRLKFVQSAMPHKSIDTQQGKPAEQAHDLTAIQQPMSRPMNMPTDPAITPNGTLEWNDLVHSNSLTGPVSLGCRMASPANAQPTNTPMAYGQDQGQVLQQDVPQMAQETQRVAPTLVESIEQPVVLSRPSSRASNKAPRKKPTGRSRGRPPKRPAEGSTPGLEETAEAEEVPAAKRSKSERALINPFVAESGSLRVMASTSASLRSVRPVASSNEAMLSNCLQEGPRAPTPRPTSGAYAPFQARSFAQSNLRRESSLNRQANADTNAYSELRLQPYSPHLERSRTPDSRSHTPIPSDGSMASSPPIHPEARFLHSSPMQSSPILPPMNPGGYRQRSNSIQDTMGLCEQSAPPMLPLTYRQLNPTELKTTNGIPVRVFQVNQAPRSRTKPPTYAYSDGSSTQRQSMLLNQVLMPQTPHPESSDASYVPLTQANDQSRPNEPPYVGQLLAATKNPQIHQQFMHPTPPPTTDSAERPESSTGLIEPVSQFVCPDRPPMSDVTHDEHRSHGMLPNDPVQSNVPQNASQENSQSGATAKVGHCLPENGVVNESSTAVEQQPTQTTAGFTQNVADQVTHESTESISLPAGSTTRQEKPTQKRLQKRISPQCLEPRGSRPLVRSQSTGAMTLALPSIPASEPAGPSASQAAQGQPTSPMLARSKRASSSGPLALPVAVPAGASVELGHQTSNSDNVGPAKMTRTSRRPSSSSSNVKSNKNVVKKFAIKQRLEEAVNNGELPPYCSNCGAIETPTWRKIWVQVHQGIPDYCEYSEKPGRVTAIEVMKRDADDKPVSYRLIKKSLGPTDDKSEWQELLLCNPCGIWLTKCKCQRPADRWDKDFSRLGQERRRRGAKGNARSKKGGPASGVPVNPTSETHAPTDAPTDAPGPEESSLPNATCRQSSQAMEVRAPAQQGQLSGLGKRLEGTETGSNGRHSNPGTTHSRGQGTRQSPVLIGFDEEVGSAKRLLFPSPRKDGTPKALGELDVNVVVQKPCDDDVEQRVPKTTGEASRELAADNVEPDKEDALEELFQSPVAARAFTPPCMDKQCRTSPGPFKTPTRPTPSRRPVTRSVTRSLRSRRMMTSPSQALQQTPTKGQMAGCGEIGSARSRRSVRQHHVMFDGLDHSDLEGSWIGHGFDELFFDPVDDFMSAHLEVEHFSSIMESESNLVVDSDNCGIQGHISWDSTSLVLEHEGSTDTGDLMEE
ncbi:hypothetical protein CDD82_4142 [Ophiocordyceps australis]|uniref:Ams2/SPT21 N-terminal domain-containing protein n=1 Tax=Ophiocordyceps australis TaxID=1399860 RepID=A0A2C5ZA87_9HYPO|nr:hypothetical protein CDD82_4142 [Ophiocordyceps australis]